ncbi:MAG: M81 family peptidase, partial [Sphingobacteriales bacterium]
MPRIAIAGLGVETSTFSPGTTDEASFDAKYGQQVMSNYPFLAADSAMHKRAVWLPALHGQSIPGGPVTRKAYESLVRRMLDSLKKNGPYDGLYFDIHGAMSVEGLDDPEADMLKRIRAVTGSSTVISTSMDLHGNVSESLAANTDLITCHRMAPHEDGMETKRRAVENLLERLESGKGKPGYKAWVQVPVLLPGEKTSTRIEPGKSLYAAVGKASKRPGI